MNHGTRTTYIQGCRCPACTQANTEYARLYALRKYPKPIRKSVFKMSEEELWEAP